MKVKNRRGWIVSLSSVLMILSVTNAGGQEVPIGARPTAMGNAFVAVADDGNAAFWNPAGLTLLQGLEMNSMYADLYATGIEHGFLGLTFPLKNWGSFGLAWSRIGFDDFELTYGESQFFLSHAFQLPYNISFGLNAKLLRTDTQYEDVSFGDAHGWGLDLGLLYRSFHRLSLGLVLKDVGDTGVKYDTGNSATVLEQSLSLGASYKLTDQLLVAGSLDNRLHWGGEYWLSDALALRAGLQDDLESNEPLSWSFGAGFRFRLFQFDYAYVDVPTLPSTHRFSFAVRFKQEEPWVHIEWIHLDDLFAAQYKRYVNHPIGEMKAVNVSDKTVTVKAGIEFNDFTDGPFFSNKTTILKPEESKELSLYVIFSHTISEVTADGSVQGKVTLLCSAEDEDRERDVTATQKANLFGRNAIRWDDIRKVAAFIEPKDRDVRAVTSQALNKVDEDISYLSQNVLNAIAIFDLLGELGLTYSPDPQTPYSAASRLHEIVDHVQYPSETLAEKRGDCDDFVVLYASCLENVGIPTAIIDVPGHLLLAVDVGVEKDDGTILGFEENAFLSRDGKIWIPVETTVFGKSFHHAWQEGVRILDQWSDEVHVVEVEQAWQSYPSNEIDVQTAKGSLYPKALNLLVNDLEELRRQKYRNILREIGAALDSSPVPCSTYNEVGVRLGQAGLLDEAIDLLKKACLADTNSTQSFNNLGVAYSKKGHHQKAVKAFQRALDLNPQDADVHLNLAFLYYESGDLERAKTEYEAAVKLNPEYKGRFRFLEKKPDLQKKEREAKPKRGNFVWK